MKDNNASNHNPFKTPENYFSEFDQRLMQRIEQHSISIEPKVKARRSLFFYYGVAASIAIIVALSWSIHLNNNSITTADLQNYIQYETSLTLSDDFLDSFDQQDLIELETSLPLDQKQVNEYVLTDLDIDYYLNY